MTKAVITEQLRSYKTSEPVNRLVTTTKAVITEVAPSEKITIEVEVPPQIIDPDTEVEFTVTQTSDPGI